MVKITRHKKSIKVPKVPANISRLHRSLKRDMQRIAEITDIPFPRREIDLQREIIRWARARGYACGKTKVQGMKQPDGRYFKDQLAFRGFPDLVMFTPALVFVEVKGPNGKLRPDQREFGLLCLRAGVKYIVAKSVMDVIKEVNK